MKVTPYMNEACHMFSQLQLTLHNFYIIFDHYIFPMKYKYKKIDLDFITPGIAVRTRRETRRDKNYEFVLSPRKFNNVALYNAIIF